MRVRTAVAAMLVVGPASTLRAQNASPSPVGRYLSLTAFAGSSGYDLAGGGRAGSRGVRVGVTLAPFLVIEPGVTWFGYQTQDAEHIGYAIAEISLQLQTSRGAVRPYIGGGAGYAFIRSGPAEGGRTVHGEIGLRARLVPHLSFTTEARVRDMSWFRVNDTMVDYLWGLSLIW
ncbi:MAG: hypothetical protein ACREL5_11650 [Gemmatimonadales bacterium]